MQNGFKKSSILRSKIEKNLCRNVLKTHAFLDIVFSGILAGFGAGLGRVWEALDEFFRPPTRLLKGIHIFFAYLGGPRWILGGSWDAFGSILGGLGELLGGFWQGFGRVWELFWGNNAFKGS